MSMFVYRTLSIFPHCYGKCDAADDERHLFARDNLLFFAKPYSAWRNLEKYILFPFWKMRRGFRSIEDRLHSVPKDTNLNSKESIRGGKARTSMNKRNKIRNEVRNSFFGTCTAFWCQIASITIEKPKMHKRLINFEHSSECDAGTRIKPTNFNILWLNRYASMVNF